MTTRRRWYVENAVLRLVTSLSIGFVSMVCSEVPGARGYVAVGLAVLGCVCSYAEGQRRGAYQGIRRWIRERHDESHARTPHG
jgi:hypothetical protein